MRAVIGRCAPKGCVVAPPSKSMAHRLLICAGLANGTSVINGIEYSEDIKATLGCLAALGVDCKVDGERVTVCGSGGVSPTAVLNCGECGSTLRFFVPICLLSPNESRLTGSARLMQRPLSVYEKMCAEKGLYYRLDGDTLTLRGVIGGGSYSLPADVSSQFISGLLFALPLTEKDSVLRLEGQIESKPYIDMTLASLSAFGVSAYWQSETELFVQGAQRYSARTLTVEGDYSNAAFFEALNYLGGNVTVSGLERDSMQGDRVYGMLFPMLAYGCPTFDVSDCPDLAPILFVLAAFKNGARFTGTARLRLKESDRGAAMACELAKCGVRTDIEENAITVHAGIKAPTKPLFGHNDHRVVMALTVLLTALGGELEGTEAVNKSFPSFFRKLSALGADIDIYE